MAAVLHRRRDEQATGQPGAGGVAFDHAHSRAPRDQYVGTQRPDRTGTNDHDLIVRPGRGAPQVVQHARQRFHQRRGPEGQAVRQPVNIALIQREVLGHGAVAIHPDLAPLLLGAVRRPSTPAWWAAQAVGCRIDHYPVPRSEIGDPRTRCHDLTGRLMTKDHPGRRRELAEHDAPVGAADAADRDPHQYLTVVRDGDRATPQARRAGPVEHDTGHECTG
jgi:hypothetical protein